MQTTRYLSPNGKSVELIRLAADRYLLCTESPRYVPADEVDALFEPAEDRRVQHPSRRQRRGGGRRRRDRISVVEDNFRAKTHEMLQSAELNLARIRARSSDEDEYDVAVIE